jgi:hypothetical protein
VSPAEVRIQTGAGKNLARVPLGIPPHSARRALLGIAAICSPCSSTPRSGIKLTPTQQLKNSPRRHWRNRSRDPGPHQLHAGDSATSTPTAYPDWCGWPCVRVRYESPRNLSPRSKRQRTTPFQPHRLARNCLHPALISRACNSPLARPQCVSCTIR